jgi:acyl-CoA thioesterase FadM
MNTMTALNLSEVVCYKGLVQTHQTDKSGELCAEAAASIAADALAGFLAIGRGSTKGQGGAPSASDATVVSMTLTKAGPSMRGGDVAICWFGSSTGATASPVVEARLSGPLGTAWQAVIRLSADAPDLPHDTSSPSPDAALPPMRIMRAMRKNHCDQAGHVNVQVFMDLADDAVGVFCREALGDAPRLQIVKARISFKRELFEGDVVIVHSGLQRIDSEGMHVVHGIVQQPSGLLACVVETCLGRPDASVDPAASMTAPPGEVVADWPSLPLARPPSLPRPSASPLAQAVTTAVSVVDAWDADHTGRLGMRAMINLCSTGARQYLATVGLNGARFLREKITVAAVDYLIDVHRRPSLGCNLTMRSAFLSGSAKSIRFTHHLLDSDDGTAYATVEIVGVMLDLKTHRSMEIPGDVRQRLGLATD